MTGPVTSLTLLGKLRQGAPDESAWREFVHLYAPLVYRLCRQKGLDRDDADSVVQDFCVRAVRAMPTFEYLPQKGRFRNWVLTVALNEIRSLLRKRGRYQRIRDDYERDAIESAEPLLDPVQEWWAAAESRRMLHVALDRLKHEIPPMEFSIFCGVTLEGKSVENVTTFYGVTASQVYAVKYRVLRRLRAIALSIEENWNDR